MLLAGGVTRLTFVVSVEIDPDHVGRQAARISVSDQEFNRHAPSAVRQELAYRIENALSDAVIHKDGIVAGSVRVVRTED